MEPFGILNFLQTLLNGANFSQSTDQNSMETKENSPPSPTSEAAQKPSAEQMKNAPSPEHKSEQQNAFTQFVAAHDARVKKTKDK